MLKCTFVISPAWNKRDPNPNKDYGIHCCDLFFYLSGDEGFINLQIFTGWYLLQDRHALKELGDMYPTGSDLSYHSKVPLYEGQELSRKDCRLTGGDCYCDGSTLLAEDLTKDMVIGGSNVVWKRMLEFYNEKFKTSYKIEDTDAYMLKESNE
jgi:hypothetical protein